MGMECADGLRRSVASAGRNGQVYGAEMTKNEIFVGSASLFLSEMRGHDAETPTRTRGHEGLPV